MSALHWALVGVYAAILVLMVAAPLLQPPARSPRWGLLALVAITWPVVFAALVLAAALVGTTRQLREWLK